MQALNDWGNAVSSEAQQLLTYNMALAILERQTGTILETHGLVFNEERFRAAGPLPCHDRLYPSPSRRSAPRSSTPRGRTGRGLLRLAEPGAAGQETPGGRTPKPRLLKPAP